MIAQRHSQRGEHGMARSASRAVVVTGASTGIGRACALALDAAGFRVFAGVRRAADARALARVASERLETLPIEVTDPDCVAAATEHVAKQVDGGGLAGLVNNAGIAVAGPLELLPVEELRRQLEVSVIGVLSVTQAFLPLVRARAGRIVNMGSVTGSLGLPFLGPYSSAKSALASLTDALRMELLPWGIRVVLVEPGSVDTPIWSRSRREGDALVERAAPERRALYREAVAAMRDFAERRAHSGVAPEVVARAVHHALSARRPRTRYAIGRDARLEARLLRPLPDRLRDRLILRRIGLPRRTGG
jgi:NAD(P)-dependent dehydrogenase (short-subunit alcohol dehydrogenase family)